MTAMANFALDPVPVSKWDPFLIGWMIVVHLVALTGPFAVTWGAVGVFVVLYVFTACIGITFGYHRLQTHRSFKCARWLERFAATAGVLALQGGPIEWVGHHRMHHAG